MAKTATKTKTAPNTPEPPTGYGNLMGGWKMPTEDQEFVFTSLDEAPGWVDRGWLAWSAGPALALPAGDLYGKPPYTTKIARVGDTVKFIAGSGAMPPRFEVIVGDHSLDPGLGTMKPAQASNASLEDMLKGGHIAPEDLGTDAKAQVAYRSPELHRMIEGAEPAPEPQAPAVAAQPIS